MNLSNRKLKILQELLKQEDYITGRYLGNILGVSSRTIRTEIASLHKEMAAYNIVIFSEAGKGYLLSKDSKSIIKEMIQGSVEYKTPVLPDQRVNHIIKQLLLYPKGIVLYKISKDLFVSESTLKRDISIVNKYLGEYNLCLSKNDRNEYYIFGNEVKIRNLYRHYFSKNTVEGMMIGKLNEKRIESKGLIKNILNQHYIELTGNEFNHIAMFLAIQLFRIDNGYVLNDYKKTELIEEKIHFYFNELVEALHITIEEENYLVDFLHDYFGDTGNKNVTKLMIQSLLEKVEGTFDYCPSEYIERRLTSLFKRNKHFSLQEFNLHDLKTDFPYAFEVGTTFIQLMTHTFEVEISAELFLQIMLEFVNDVEAATVEKELKTVKVILITDSGMLSSNLIKSRLKRYFSHISIEGSFAPFEKDTMEQLNPDMVLSTVPFTTNDIPVIIIDPILKDYDVLKISNAIRKLENPETIHYEFSNLFKEDLFIKELDVENPYEAIKALHSLMIQKGVSDESFLLKVFEREEVSPTSVGNMVAIPHSIGTTIKGNTVAVGILKKPIKWSNEDVQIVFLMNIGKSKDGKVKQIFDSFFEVVQDDKKIKQLLKSKNYYEFIKNITQ